MSVLFAVLAVVVLSVVVCAVMHFVCPRVAVVDVVWDVVGVVAFMLAMMRFGHAGLQVAAMCAGVGVGVWVTVRHLVHHGDKMSAVCRLGGMLVSAALVWLAVKNGVHVG
jgi:lipid-A-disaccharide synthase-like uncharacterized protein